MSVARRILVEVPEVPAPTRPDGAASRSLRHALVGLDCLAVASGWSIAIALSHSAPYAWSALEGTVAVTAFSLLLLASQRLYRARVCSVRLVEAVGLLRVAIGAGTLWLVLPGPATAGRLVAALLGGALTFTFLVGTRGFYDSWLRSERARGRFIRSVAIVGRGREADHVVELLRYHPELGYRACGLVGDREVAQKHNLPWLGSGHNVDAIVASGAGGVLLVTAGMPSDELGRLMRDLLAAGLHIQVSAGLWQVDQRRLRAAPLAHEPFYYLEPPVLSSRQLRLKRTLDLVLAGIVVVIAAPVLLACAAAVKLADGGPVLFRQTRIGRDGRPFTLLKFRTMVVDAEARLAALRAENRRSGPLFKLDDDPRVTRVGRVLRATSLDELPQLFNVLGGSMGLVGPRPALPSEVADFDAGFLSRHRVPPGITGLWQLEARENASFYAYRHLDLFYVENWSCALDLVILAGTIPALLARSLRCVVGRAEIAGEQV